MLPHSSLNETYYQNRKRNAKWYNIFVNSDIIKVEKNLAKETPNEELLKIDVDKLRKLLTIIDDYLLLLGEDMSEFNTEEDFNEDYIKKRTQPPN